MCVQFGTCNFDGKPIERSVLHSVRPVLEPYGPDGEGLFEGKGAGILYRALHTNRESRSEIQPYISDLGMVITWDGRLDNREELTRQLGGALAPTCTDLSIVASAYEKWNTGSFQNIIGDWALSIWNPEDRSLTLARDFAGTRQLFYSVQKDHATWCTILDPLLLLAGHSFKLEEEYIAGWLSHSPSFELTPYIGIRSVAPASFVRIESKNQSITRFWDFNPSNSIRYRTDQEYEDHFRSVLFESVRRRMRSDSTVMAELSGGMDSSSIACIADTVIKQGAGNGGDLDTISYYDDSEPNWDEWPYFTKVEEKLRKQGHHIDVGHQNPFRFDTDVNRFMTNPTSAEFSEEARGLFQDAMLSSGSRVLLSGTGGDEVTGGVPTPLPELQDLIARARWKRLAHQLKAWALNKRRPWIHLVSEAAAGFLPSTVIRPPKHLRPAPWINKKFIKRHRLAFDGYDTRLKLFGPLPTFQQNVAAFNLLRRQIGCDVLSACPVYEKRYPYLDRNLVEFMYGIPRDQVVRPGQRRSLIRRALAAIVPKEILERKRKAYVARSAMVAISSEWPRLRQMFQQSISGALGVINDSLFLEALNCAGRGKDVPMVAVARTLFLEVWLRNLHMKGILAGVENNVPVFELARTQTISAEEIQLERR